MAACARRSKDKTNQRDKEEKGQQIAHPSLCSRFKLWERRLTFGQRDVGKIKHVGWCPFNRLAQSRITGRKRGPGWHWRNDDVATWPLQKGQLTERRNVPASCIWLHVTCVWLHEKRQIVLPCVWLLMSLRLWKHCRSGLNIKNIFVTYNWVEDSNMNDAETKVYVIWRQFSTRQQDRLIVCVCISQRNKRCNLLEPTVPNVLHTTQTQIATLCDTKHSACVSSVFWLQRHSQHHSTTTCWCEACVVMSVWLV